MSAFPVLFAIIKVLYVVLNAGLVIRFYFAMRGSRVPRAVLLGLCLIAIGLSLAFPASRSLEGNSAFIRGVTLAGYLWFAFTLHALMAWAVVDGFRILNWRFKWWVIAPEKKAYWCHRACAGIIAAAMLMCAAGWVNSRFPVVREEKLPVPANFQPLRIVALSDLHLGRGASEEFLSSVVDLIEPLSPDIVLFLGDILEYDFDPADAPANAAVLRRLHPRLGIWGVMGNHEYLGGQGGKLRRALEQIGIRMLVDQWVTIEPAPGEKIRLIGRRDRSVGRKPVSELLATAPKDGALKILMDHQPVDLKGAEDAGVYLQLSGHSHNGQFFPVNFIVALLFEKAHGYYRRGETHYWVSSGVGAWGPRIRTSGRPEIVMIDLVPQEEAK